MTIHCLPFLFLSQTHRVTHKNFHCCSSFQLQSPRKRYEFFYSHYIFHIYSFVFLDLWGVVEVLRNMVFKHGFVLFVEFGCLGSIDLNFRMLNIIVIMFVVSVLSMFIDLCWFEHLIPIELCLIDICLFFLGFLWYTLFVSMVGSQCLFIAWLDYVFGSVP